MSLFIWFDIGANERKRWLQTEDVRDWIHKLRRSLLEGECWIYEVGRQKFIFLYI